MSEFVGGSDSAAAVDGVLTGLGRRSTVPRIASGLTRDPTGDSVTVFTSI